ncbi:ShK domain-containing protein, partial [Trichostrongylus colubriformis]
CIDGACANASFQCINTTTGEVCCELSQIAPAAAGTTPACIDQVNPKTGRSDCQYKARQCVDPKYRDVMQAQCPRTCGFCEIGGSTLAPVPVGECRDLLNPATSKSDCADRFQYCQDPIYRDLMAQQCPLTCGYCGV